MDKVKLPRIKRSTPVDPRVFRKFLTFLPPLVRVLAETYKFACEVYAEIGLLYYWSEIFCLPASSVFKPERGLCQIFLYRKSTYARSGERGYEHYLSDDLATKLLELSQTSQGGLLFRQEDGSSFNYRRMVKEFCRASQRALKEGAIQQAIIPIHLRTTPSSEIQFLPGVHREVSEEKVQEIAKINLSSYRNAGRHRTKPLKDILEMLLEQEYFGYSRSEFIRHFPAARAAEAQKRRWKKRGIWLQISQILQS